MRHLLFILLLLPMAVFAQTKADYEHAMRKFVRFYNKGQGDSILNMWPESMRGLLAEGWTRKAMKEGLKEEGPITSFAYLGIDEDDAEKVTVYKVVYGKRGPTTFSFTLEKDGSLGTLRMITKSDGIKKLLEKDDAKRK